MFRALLSLALGAWALCHAPAHAQDGWTGFYVGGGIARRDADVTWNTTCVQLGFPGSACPDASGVFADRFAANNPASFDHKALALTGFLGWQWQWNWLVLGVEGDFTHARKRHTQAAIPGAEDPATALSGTPDSASVTTDWDASVRGRVGISPMPSLLAYATAGPSWIRTSVSATCGAEFPAGWCSAGNIGLTETVTATQRGWTWGGGLDWMLTPSILLRGEYRISRYDALEHTFLDGRLGNADTFSTRTTLDTRTMMLGLGYRF